MWLYDFFYLVDSLILYLVRVFGRPKLTHNSFFVVFLFYKTVKMSEKLTLHFIRLVKEREVLWNRANPIYKDVYKQKRAWADISNIVNIPAIRLIQKWESLRGSYRCYHAKVSQTAGTPNAFKPIWFAYDAMCFLGQVKQPPYTKLNITKQKVSAKLLPKLPPAVAPFQSTTKNGEAASTEVNEHQPDAKSLETSPKQELSDTTPIVPQPSTSGTANRKGCTKLLANLMANEAETLDLLRSLAKPIQQPSDAAQFGITVSGLVSYVVPEERERLYKRIIETISNHDTYDEDVESYGTTIKHLLQNMIKSKRKSAYYSIVQLISKFDETE
uniref:MADF domain-containing protein n=1 Tax=Anopheles maculatus TaxID=74869 RepID=A0A182TAR6_9DIPT